MTVMTACRSTLHLLPISIDMTNIQTKHSIRPCLSWTDITWWKHSLSTSRVCVCVRAKKVDITSPYNTVAKRDPINEKPRTDPLCLGTLLLQDGQTKKRILVFHGILTGLVLWQQQPHQNLSASCSLSHSHEMECPARKQKKKKGTTHKNMKGCLGTCLAYKTFGLDRWWKGLSIWTMCFPLSILLLLLDDK